MTDNEKAVKSALLDADSLSCRAIAATTEEAAAMWAVAAELAQLRAIFSRLTASPEPEKPLVNPGWLMKNDAPSLPREENK